MLRDNSRRWIYLSGIFAVFYFIAGIIGLFSYLYDSYLLGKISEDPIEMILLILTAIIYFRGYLKLKREDKSGTAFILVAAIVGIILGGLSFLNLIINSGLSTFLTDFSLISAYNRIIEDFSLIIVVGLLSLIPFKFIQTIEQNLVIG